MNWIATPAPTEPKVAIASPTIPNAPPITPAPTKSNQVSKPPVAATASLSEMKQYIAARDATSSKIAFVNNSSNQTLLETRVNDSKNFVVEQNNMLLLGTLTMAIMILGGMIIFDS
jgi:hypothetical protein